MSNLDGSQKRLVGGIRPSMLTSIKESSMEMSGRSLRVSQESTTTSTGGANKDRDTKKNESGYDYLRSVIENDGSKTAAENEIPNRTNESDSSLRINNIPQEIANGSSSGAFVQHSDEQVALSSERSEESFLRIPNREESFTITTSSSGDNGRDEQRQLSPGAALESSNHLKRSNHEEDLYNNSINDGSVKSYNDGSVKSFLYPSLSSLESYKSQQRLNNSTASFGNSRGSVFESPPTLRSKRPGGSRFASGSITNASGSIANRPSISTISNYSKHSNESLTRSALKKGSTHGQQQQQQQQQRGSVVTFASNVRENNNNNNKKMMHSRSEKFDSRSSLEDSRGELSLMDSTHSYSTVDGEIPSSEEFFSDPSNHRRRPARINSLYSDGYVLGSEQFFVDPKKGSQQRKVGFSIHQNAESMQRELEDIEKYLATLKQSVNLTRKTLDIGSATTETSNDSTASRPGLDKSKQPKSRRRFSMAYRTNDEVVTFPDDCFSFLSLHGPIESPLFFWFAFFISFLQLGFLILALLSMVHPVYTATGPTDNPSNRFFFFPSSVTGLMRLTQFFAVLSYCIFADMSVKDYLTALELFPQYSKLEKGDNYWCMVFSCVLRFVMGLLTVIVTLIMLLTNTSVIDTILDFLAMNFIGDIGKMAFQLCLWGKYGRKLEMEARRIEDMPLPNCMLRRPSKNRYATQVAPIVLFAIGLMVWLFVFQEADLFWTTKHFRVEFEDNSPLEAYTGCYDMSNYFTGFNARANYDSFEGNKVPAKFGYCANTRTWSLFKGEEQNACEVTNEETLLRSSSTTAFDINGALGSPWYDKHGTQVMVSFQSESQVDLAKCNAFMHDGHCDVEFNDFDGDYDGGDCCAATCGGSNCGVGALETAFGTNVYGDGFPKCEDPSMVPITIMFESIVDSWTYYERKERRQKQEQQPSSRTIEGDASVVVIEPIMVLDCDDKNIMTVHVNEAMNGRMEILKIEDGANCTIRINNSTSASRFDENPIWYVNYTIYHGDISAAESDPIVILRDQSANNEFATFRRYPECYFDKLSDYIDNTTIYTGGSPEHEAIKWLRLDSRFSRNSDCQDDFFLERYALYALNFAAPFKPTTSIEETEHGSSPTGVSSSDFYGSTAGMQDLFRNQYHDDYLWIEDRRQCIWRTVECSQRSVNVLDLNTRNLDGTVSTSIGILTNLTKLDLADNEFKGRIPTEIGELTLLRGISFANNVFSGPIPSEIGHLAALEFLNVAYNSLSGAIPTEIGLLTSTKKLNLTGNDLEFTIPTEIGSMTALEVLDLSQNLLTGRIPTELGDLARNHNLKKVFVGSNDNLDLVNSGSNGSDNGGNGGGIGLRDVLYTDCPTQDCLPFRTTEHLLEKEECNALWIKHGGDTTTSSSTTWYHQLPMDDCQLLRTECLVCSTPNDND